MSDPYAIFSRAQTYWAATQYPRSVAYEVAVRVSIRGHANVVHYHSYWSSLENRVFVNGISDEARAHPYVPHGIKTELRLIVASIPMSTAEFTDNYLGVPRLAPDYSFGMSQFVPGDEPDSQALVSQIRRCYQNAAKPIVILSPAPGGLKTISSVQVRPRDYLIALHGMADIRGHINYDLRLQPVRDPGRYRLREAWIDAQSFATDRLITDGNFYDGPGNAGRVPWQVDFVQQDGVPYIASESTNATLNIERRTYAGATVTFENYRTASIPAYASMWSSSGPELTEPNDQR